MITFTVAVTGPQIVCAVTVYVPELFELGFVIDGFC